MSAPAAKSAPRTGAGLLVKSLEAQGVEYVFGIPEQRSTRFSIRSWTPRSKPLSADMSKTLRSWPVVSAA